MSERPSNPSVKHSTLVELLRRRVLSQPDDKAYTFLLNGETEAISWTYTELDRQARIIGGLLQQLQATGERVLLLYPPGLEYIAAFFGCLYAGAVAVPAYPPHSTRSMPRIQTIAQDALAVIALTNSQFLTSKERWFSAAHSLKSLHWLATDTITNASGLENNWQPPVITGDTLAFLQYTSGSTAAPKGVMISHDNLLHNLAQIQQSAEATLNDHLVSWLPPYHDMGLIGGILYPLSIGFPATLMAPVAFLQRPLRWLQAISRTHATVSVAPNFAYDLCTAKITPEQMEGLDLSSLRIVFNGAEPIRWQTLERFAATFAPYGFRREVLYPCYGLAEATLIVSGGKLSALPVIKAFLASALDHNTAITSPTSWKDTRTLVGCGQALLDQRICIVHPESSSLCTPDQIGEIWVAGPSIAQGYWNCPIETRQTFQAYLAATNEGPFLRTADLGIFHDGELFITGRIKDLIIIRGRNHYPQDIEQTVERSHSALRQGCSAAFSIDITDEERVVVVQELERRYYTIDVEVVARAIRQAVAEQYELYVYAVVLIKAATIPKTSSGKIQRHTCRSEYLTGKLSLIGSSIHEEDAPGLEKEEQINRAALLAVESGERQRLVEVYLQKRVAQVLHASPSTLPLYLQQPLSTLGLDSLMATELAMSIETDLEIVIPIEVFLQGPSIAQLGAMLLTHVNEGTSTSLVHPLVRMKKNLGKYPLSLGQQLLWFFDQLVQLKADNPLYNMPFALHLAGWLDIPSLEESLNEIVRRHAILRVTFAAVKWYAVQIIEPEVRIKLLVEDLSHLPQAERVATAQQLTHAEAREPFDLGEGPLLRARLLHLSKKEHVLLLTMHHIVSDGWSIGVFLRELTALYQAYSEGKPSPLSELPIQYTDFVLWQQEWLQSKGLEKQLAYWKQQLRGATTLLELPKDQSRSVVPTFQGAAKFFVIPQTLTASLRELSRQESCTLFMTLLAAFAVLLYRYTGQEDILIGSPIAGRTRKELEGLIGFFINMLVLRANLSGQPDFRTVLQRVRQTALGAYAHPNLPFEMLLEVLQPKWDFSRAPLLQVMFVLHNVPIPTMELPGLRLRLEDVHSGTSKFDLALSLVEGELGLNATLEYNTDIFNTARIEDMAKHFQALLESIVANPGLHLSDLPFLLEKHINYVQLRGFTINLSEIEDTLRHHSAVQVAVIHVRERKPGDEGLVAYVVPKRGPTPTSTDLCRYLLKRLPYYMVPPAFVMLSDMPLTEGGSVDYDALPEPNWLDYELSSTTVVSRNVPEAILGEIGTELLGLGQTREDDSFFDSGEQLLLTAQLVVLLRSRFPFNALPRWMYKIPAVAASIERARQTQFAPIRTYLPERDVPLSPAQQRFWQIDGLGTSPSPYTISLAIRLSGTLKMTALVQSLQEIVRRHEILRTTFVSRGQHPIQVIRPERNVALPVIDLRKCSAFEKHTELQRFTIEESLHLFDLAQGPLLRTILLRLDEEEAVLLITMQRIICDDWSLRIFMRELAVHYQALSAGKPSPLPELTVQYADFVQWQREQLKEAVLKEQLTYWKQQLRGASTMLPLPADRASSATQTPFTAKCSLTFSKTLIGELQDFSRREGATLFMTLLAAFKALLHRYTGQKDLLVGTPIVGRPQPELKGLIGPFANTLVLRTQVADTLSFRELLGQVRSVVWGAQNYQDVPFELLLKVIQPDQVLSYAPLFQVMFVMQETPLPTLTSAELTFRPLECNKRLTQCNLTLTVAQNQYNSVVTLEYNSDLFDASTIMRMLKQLQAVLESVVANPKLRVSDLTKSR